MPNWWPGWALCAAGRAAICEEGDIGNGRSIPIEAAQSCGLWRGPVCMAPVLLVWRVLRAALADSGGCFQQRRRGFAGRLQGDPGLRAGPEDFEVDAAHAAILSSTNRRAPRVRRPPPTALCSCSWMRRSAACEAGRHAEGFSSARHQPLSRAQWRRDPDGGQSSQRRHQRRSRFSASAYDNDAARLVAHSSIGGGLLVSPQDIFAVGPGSFYVTNDHVTKTALGRFAEDYLLWPHADVLYFNGTSFRSQCSAWLSQRRLCQPGWRPSLCHRSPMSAALIGFTREPFTGSLTEIGSLSMPGAAGQYFGLDAQGRPDHRRPSQSAAGASIPRRSGKAVAFGRLSGAA